MMKTSQHAFSRQPRFMPDMPGGEVAIPDPPYSQEKPDIAWFTILAPPAVMLVITFMLALTSQSMFLLISIATTAITLVTSLTGAASQIRRYKNRKKERESKYLQFIADRRSELAIAREQQAKAMNELHPEPAVCLQRIGSLDGKLWERTSSYPDFLALRLGLGNVPLSMTIKHSPQAILLESDPLQMEPQRLALEFERVPDVPVAVDLAGSEICGIAGEDGKTAELARLMLLQLITHHGYDDVRVVVLAADDGAAKWDWLKFLPHLWDDAMETRYLLCGKAVAHQALGDLYAVLKDREFRTVGGSTLPHYVFVVEDASLLDYEPINKYVFNRCGHLGVSSVFLAGNQAYLPMNCRTVITLQGKTGELADRESGGKILFRPDKLDFKSLQQTVRRLGPLRLRENGASFSLPASVTLLDLLRVRTVGEVELAERWSRNRTFKGISVPIGVKGGGSLFSLDLHETGHGPHGLVAGTTGSGKSELLQSIIISLAVNYHPHDIVFVLIDYKGGGMADVFKGMPHLVGTITNLGGNQTTRALLSIKSELQRRQRLFSRYGVNNIDRYQKLYYSLDDRGDMPPIPHLVMIADEFAELKQDQPEFMKELVSAARVGRSLGVHLILATQKPAGVVDDQIWSNSKFKICLKVQDEADSKDVIKRPDAALIKEPGRAYIQVGNDEIFELFQSAYSGADYDPEGEMLRSENRVKRIYELGPGGRAEQIYPAEEEKIAARELPSQLKAMVDHIASTARDGGILPLEGPWMPPLPEQLDLKGMLPEAALASCESGIWPADKPIFAVSAGMLDDPRGQLQEPLVIDFAAEGNLFVYGAPGTGKTVLLRTLCLSIAMSYSPDEARIYVMDFGGSSFKAMEKLPHCGGVMTLEQESRISQFMLYIFRLMEERKRLFEQSGSDGFADYRGKGGRLPAVAVVIDNYFALSETYEAVDDKMIVLAREGFKYGIYMVVTATNSALVRYKFAVNFKMSVSLQLTDKSEYDGIVGRTEGLVPARVPGRALVRGTPPLEFQTALPEWDGLGSDVLIGKFSRLAEDGLISRAEPIPMMPERIFIDELNDGGADVPAGGRIAIGLADRDLQPVSLELAATPVVMVAGDPMAGKSTLLVSWVEMLRRRLGDDGMQVYVQDSSSMGLYPLLAKPGAEDLSRIEDMYAFTEELKEELAARRSQLLAVRRSGGDADALMASWKQLVFVIDRLSEFTAGDQYALKELLERIVKQERGMKVAVLAADTTSELANNWDSLGKAIREEQTGILLGSLKDQNLYNARLPYGSQEKEFEQGDGYLVVKNKFTGLRTAILSGR